MKVSFLMTNQNKQELRQMLVARRDALDLELINKTKSVVNSGTDGEIQRAASNSVDDADRNSGYYVDAALTEMKIQTLAKLKESIQRLDEGSYGICSNCSNPISVKRLEALPFAARCKNCEENKENREAEDTQTKKRHQHTPSFMLSGETRSY